MNETKLCEGVDLEQYIKISADSISELRKVDVYRVINSIRSDNLDGVSRSDLATFIATKRSDLVAEVTEVMREDFPQEGWAADCVAGRKMPGKSIEAYQCPSLVPSGRFIIDQDHRKVAEMYQPDSPVEMEAIKRRIVGSFNALPDLVGVLLRADKEGALWQALSNEGITGKYDEALSCAVKALGDVGIADVAHRYELDPEAIRAKLVVE
jgi:hypothetical protein